VRGGSADILFQLEKIHEVLLVQAFLPAENVHERSQGLPAFRYGGQQVDCSRDTQPEI
jgi:hypothetical protein